MRHFILGVFCLLSFIITPAMGQGIDFFHGTWQEAMAKAKAEDKLIFVDAYAEWCGPCKAMAKNVFTTAKAGAFFNENFINLKVDMEKPENSAFANKYPVSAYPTLLFIQSDGKVALKQVGGMNLDGLLDFGKKAMGSQTSNVDYEAQYKEGNRDPKFLYDYVRTLNRTGKPSLKITNEYLATQKDLTTPFNLQFLLEGTTEVDSRVFDLLTQHYSAVVAQAGEARVKGRIEAAARNTVRKAIEYKQKDLLEEAKKKLAKFVPDKADAFAYDVNSQYYKATKDAKGYLKIVKAYQKEGGKNSAAQLHTLASDMAKAFPEDPKVLGQAIKWAESAAKTGGLSEYYFTLAMLYKQQGKKAEALAAARRAKEAEGPRNPTLDSLIDGLEGN